jgi:hypothetical protein
MSSRSKPFNSCLHKGLGWGLWPCPSYHLGGPAWRAFSSRSPTSPHAALALHTKSPCVNVASIITDCHSSRGSLGGHQWTWPSQPAAGPGSCFLRPSGKGLTSAFFYCILTDECNLGGAGARAVVGMF